VDPPTHAFNDNVSKSSSEVYSDDSAIHGSTPPSSTGGLYLGLLWMPPSNTEFASRVAYATINDGAPASSPAPFIKAALFSMASNVHFRMYTSSQGHMLLVFDSTIEHDVLALRGNQQPLPREPRVADCGLGHPFPCSTLEHGGHSGSLQAAGTVVENDLEWLVAVSATRFPAKH
jgi:hypothetical protein